jgi:hypothetical protein
LREWRSELYFFNRYFRTVRHKLEREAKDHVKQAEGYLNVQMQLEGTVPEGLLVTVMGWLGW